MGSRIDGNERTGNASSTRQTSRTEEAEQADEASATESASEQQPAGRGSLPDRDRYVFFREAVEGKSTEESRYRETLSGGTRGVSARELQQAKAKEGLAPHEEDLKNDLGIKTQRIQEGTNADLKASWEGDEGYIPLWGENTKESHEWKDVYSTRNFFSGESRGVHESIQKNMIGPDGEALSDQKLRQIVGEHRADLEEKGAFDDWSEIQIESWEKGATSFLERERARAQINKFDAEPADVPELAYEWSDRDVGDPDQIRAELDQWEQQQLARFDALAEEAEIDDTDSTRRAVRDRISQARETYEKIAVGDENGEMYGLPEEVETDMEGSTTAIRPEYIVHLQHNRGDIMGAYEKVEGDMDYALRARSAESQGGQINSLEADQ